MQSHFARWLDELESRSTRIEHFADSGNNFAEIDSQLQCLSRRAKRRAILKVVHKYLMNYPASIGIGKAACMVS